MAAVTAILSGQLPEKGSVLAPDKALCDTCPRNASKPDKLSIKEIKRPWEIKIDPEQCFLVQGLICHGPFTRSGCGETCINANMPCRGCFGPPEGVYDQGAKMLSALASICDVTDEAEVARMVEEVVDPAGTFYRFGMSGSMLKRKRM